MVLCQACPRTTAGIDVTGHGSRQRVNEERRDDVSDELDRLVTALALDGDDAAIRVHAEYEPLAGPEAKVFPPTYIGPTYHFEERWTQDGERVRVCVLDSY